MHRIVRVLREGQPGSAGAGEDRRLVTLDEIEVVADRARSAGLTVDLSVDVGEGRLSPAEEMTAFRIVQECLTNTLRHAGSGAGVGIRVREEDGTLLIDVTDDGAGALAGRAVAGASGATGWWACASGWNSPGAPSRPAPGSTADGRYVPRSR